LTVEDKRSLRASLGNATNAAGTIDRPGAFDCFTPAQGSLMAPRPFWKGYLKLSLVTCPVAMTPATTESEKVRFHTLNRKSGHRVVSQYVDAVSGKPVAEDDEVKGYQRGEDEYVLLEDDEIDAVALESTRTIDIDMFVNADSIGWIWYDKPHYLTPDDPVGEEAFSVIRDAMQSTRTVGISRLVMYRRERAVMLEPRGKGIVLWTLRYGDEVRDPEDYFGKISETKPDSKMMDLVSTLIDERTRQWDPAMTGDPVQARLLEIIASKKKGKKRPAKAKPKAEQPPSNVINIMDALRKSIGSEAGKRK
jgi:DNA end-binding protein Ku